MPIGSVKAIIGVLAPQYASGDSARLDDLIALAELVTGQAFGTKRNLAVALRVCHTLALEERNGADQSVSPQTDSGSGTGGAITQEKEGQLSRSYGVASKISESQPNLSATKYGLQLLELMKSCLVLPRTSSPLITDPQT